MYSLDKKKNAILSFVFWETIFIVSSIFFLKQRHKDIFFAFIVEVGKKMISGLKCISYLFVETNFLNSFF